MINNYQLKTLSKKTNVWVNWIAPSLTMSHEDDSPPTGNRLNLNFALNFKRLGIKRKHGRLVARFHLWRIYYYRNDSWYLLAWTKKVKIISCLKSSNHGDTADTTAINYAMVSVDHKWSGWLKSSRTWI